MIRALFSYAQKEVRPRGREIFRGAEWWIAVSGGLSVAAFGSNWGIADSTVGQVLTVVLAYAAVAFGFCLAGLTVALTLPDAKFVHKLATMTPSLGQVEKKKRVANAYSDLLFVFSWTAIAHWVVIALGVMLLVGCGYDHSFIANPYIFENRLLVGVFTFCVVYAICQFLITLITLSQVGNRYVQQLNERPVPN